jgi:hypothetical protein
MPQTWKILLDHQDQRRKAALLEGRARLAGTHADAEEVPFSLTLYSDQVSLNVPASTPAREFIANLTAILGPPKLAPTIKCSCDWGEGVMGAMLIVLWDLPAATAASLLRDLHGFLGSNPTTAIPKSQESAES